MSKYLVFLISFKVTSEIDSKHFAWPKCVSSSGCMIPILWEMKEKKKGRKEGWNGGREEGRKRVRNSY